MKTVFAGIALLGLVVLAFAAGASQAGAIDVPLCCACLRLDNPVGQTSSLVNGTANTALFCVPSDSGSSAPVAARCDAAGPDTELLCFATLDTSSCRSNLAEVGILCPVAGAPAAGSLNLATLAIVLGAIGALLLRRHRA